MTVNSDVQLKAPTRKFPLRDLVYGVALLAAGYVIYGQHVRLARLDDFAAGRSDDEMRHYTKFDSEIGDLDEKVRHLEMRVKDLEGKGRQ